MNGARVRMLGEFECLHVLRQTRIVTLYASRFACDAEEA
jgi:hypothetical protein